MLNIPAILKAIDDFCATQPHEEYNVVIPQKKDRYYLGMSGIGDFCLRKIWYDWRKIKPKEFPPRLYRLFRTGDIAEYRFNFWLRGIGFEVFERDSSGKQFKTTDFDGHFSGSMDGVGKAPVEFWESTSHPFLLEYKTYSEKRFSTLKTVGVKKSDPKYFAQLHAYMGYNELPAALFCAVNKNTDELYFEWVPFDRYAFKRIQRNAEHILTSTVPPERFSNIKSSWDFKTNQGCKYCELQGVCYDGEAADKNCYSCKFGEPVEDAKWECVKGREFGTVCGEWGDITKER